MSTYFDQGHFSPSFAFDSMNILYINICTEKKVLGEETRRKDRNNTQIRYTQTHTYTQGCTRARANNMPS